MIEKQYIVTPPAPDEGDELTFCAKCGDEWPESELNQDGICPDCLLNREDEQC